MSLLSVEQLRVTAGPRTLLRELSLSLEAGDSLAIVGESGSGKTQSMLALLGLQAPELSVSGVLRFEGRAYELSRGASAVLRGGTIGLALQDALAGLNPYQTIGAQLIETIRRHRGGDRSAARQQALRLLDAVRLPSAQQRLMQYPHELSGGQRQRVMLALALCGAPRVLIADEPTSALDVSLRAQMLELLAQLCRERGLALIVITHDLDVVSALCRRVLMLYAGECVEQGLSAEVLARPRHPYTRMLLQARPRLQAAPSLVAWHRDAGLPPQRDAQACIYAARCERTQPRCNCERPPWQADANGGGLRCWHPLDAD